MILTARTLCKISSGVSSAYFTSLGMCQILGIVLPFLKEFVIFPKWLKYLHWCISWLICLICFHVCICLQIFTVLHINDNKAIALAWGISFYKSGTNSPKKVYWHHTCFGFFEDTFLLFGSVDLLQNFYQIIFRTWSLHGHAYLRSYQVYHFTLQWRSVLDFAKIGLPKRSCLELHPPKT